MRSKTGCWLLAGALVLLLVILAGAAWLWLRARAATNSADPPSTVLVQLSLPSGNDEVSLGDEVAIAVHSLSPEPVRRVELYVDGSSLGAVTDPPEAAYWTWQALPSGIHTFYAVAADSAGSVGHSQALILNVLQGDGLIQAPAEEGQALEKLGAGFGASASQMAASNPQLDAAQPLHNGQLVNVPIAPAPEDGAAPAGGGGPPKGGDGSAGPLLVSIVWSIKFTEPADQAYCYESTGNGEWDKLPKDPFTFVPGVQALYTQLVPLAEKYEIQVQCWGWLSGALKYLGDGKTSFDSAQPPGNVFIKAGGFEFTGTPKVPAQPVPSAGGGGINFPPPYALREPSSAGDCTAHSNPLLAGFICNTLLNAKLKQHTLLEWEWKAPLCWPGTCQNYVLSVDGYRIYELDPVSKQSKVIRQIDNPSQKITAIPLPWGSVPCYEVSAFVNSPPQESTRATYCPGNPPQPQMAAFKPVYWVTTGGPWLAQGDCGSSEPYLLLNKYQGFGNNPEVLVGASMLDVSSCYKEITYAGGVKFSPKLPEGAAIMKAVLKYSTTYLDYHATGWASPNPDSCLAVVSKSTVDWTGSSSGIHFSKNPVLYGKGIGQPITSVSQWSHADVDVTSAVASWMAFPDTNHGLNLIGVGGPSLQNDEEGDSRCLSGLGNFELDVYYFVP